MNTIVNKLIGIYRFLGVMFVLSNGIEKSYSYFSQDVFKVTYLVFLEIILIQGKRNNITNSEFVLKISERDVLLRLPFLLKIFSVSPFLCLCNLKNLSLFNNGISRFQHDLMFNPLLKY